MLKPAVPQDYCFKEITNICPLYVPAISLLRGIRSVTTDRVCVGGSIRSLREPARQCDVLRRTAPVRATSRTVET